MDDIYLIYNNYNKIYILNNKTYIGPSCGTS